MDSSMASAASAVSSPQPSGPVALVQRALHFVMHLDKELVSIVANYGTTTYAILFAIVFAETGLVVTPFLPGDSLLFACGTLAAMGVLQLHIVAAVFIVAAILGDFLNFWIGSKVGPAAFKTDTWFLKRKNLEKTEKFYEKYGGKTIVLARFVPIVRTFAPFVAGVGSMKYSDFAIYNIGGALLWTFLFVGAGYFFGTIPAVQHNFTLVVLGIVGVSVLPVIYEIWQARKEAAEDATPNTSPDKAA